MREAMRARTLLVAAAGLALAGTALVIGLRPQPAPVTVASGPEIALPVLNARLPEADRIEFAHGDDLLWLERRGQVWGLSQAAGYPVRQTAAAALIDGLLALKLLHTVSGSPASLGVANPSEREGAGTLVRVLAVSGAVLAAIILGPETGPSYVRRPGLPTVWLASPHVTASAVVGDWISHRIAPPAGQTPGELRLQRTLAGLRFSEVRAAPQVHPEPVTSLPLSLADGTAVLSVGRAYGQDWLQISGSSAWARQLAPYAFAIPADNLPDDTP